MTTTKQEAAQTVMVEVATAMLIGRALNYAVATVEGWVFAIEHRFNDGGHNHRPGDCWSWWRREEQLAQFATFGYSTKWALGGPLIEKYKIDIGAPMEAQSGPWNAASEWGHPNGYKGETPLIAACRAIVARHIGDTVSVPAELVEASV